MAPRFHVLNAKLLLDSIYVDTPTEDEYEKFLEPDLSSKPEHELCQELVSGRSAHAWSELPFKGPMSDPVC